jgi:predicted peptidase
MKIRTIRNAFKLLAAALALSIQPCLAEELLTTTAHYQNGEEVPYILNYQSPDPGYVVILFPGGSGRVDPRMEDGKLVYGLKGNFLLRSRNFIVDDAFATVTTNSSNSEERIQAVLNDIKVRFPKAKIYLMGTSNGTYSTISLADYLSDKIAGVIHTSSRSQIYFFDAKKYKNRQLVVHQKNDGCHVTPFSAAERSHEKYGNELIVMEGGKSAGDPCEAFAYHGYNGIENETIQAIKKWIRQAD